MPKDSRRLFIALVALSWLEFVPEAFVVTHFCSISLKDLYLNDKMFSIFEKKKPGI